jgi:hypothetical protein
VAFPRWGSPDPLEGGPFPDGPLRFGVQLPTAGGIGSQGGLGRKRGLSEQDLAQRAALPLKTIQAIESGTRLPSKPEFAQLARALELPEGRLAEIRDQ